MKSWLLFSYLSLCSVCALDGVSAAEISIAAAELEPHAGEQLPQQGWVPQVLGIALKQRGYQAHFQFLPFRRALRSAERGYVDAISPLYISETRKQHLLFSEPLGLSQTVLFYRRAKPIVFNKIADLAGLRVVVMRGARVSDEFDRAVNIERIEVTSYEQQVRMLMMGRVDALVGEEFVVRSVMARTDKHAADLLVQADTALATQGIYAAVSKAIPDAEAKIQAINIGLAEMKASGSFSKILAGYGISYDAGLLRQAQASQ